MSHATQQNMLRGVLLIVIDCLRADHVSAYGYGRNTTPTIDSLAEKGILWEQAHSVSSWTKPSVTSMLTGVYPSQHGAFEGIKRSKGRSIVTTDRLQSSQSTLAEEFSRNGWRCGAFINNAQLGEFTRLNRGFSSYAPSAGKADRLIGIFLEWLEADTHTPFFAYLHFLEAHWPYKPRRRHVKMFGGNRDTNYFRDFSARDYGKLRRAISQGAASLSQEQLQQMIQMYDGAVRRLDGKLKIILAMLNELGLRDQTAIIVTADHGEEFLDHGRIGHGQSLYNELTHVPLIMSLPDDAHGFESVGPIRDRNTVSLVNLPCTILGMAGIESAIPGRDLRAPSETQELTLGELRVGWRYQQTATRSGWKLHRGYRFKPPNGKLSRDISPRRLVEECPYDVSYELYNVHGDPSERDNQADDPQRQSVLRELEGDLDRWWGEVSRATPLSREVTPSAPDQFDGDVEIDSTVVQRLHDLGYID
ncbi:MAG: sulfatase [Phycisphaerae bacterium]